MKLAGHSFLGGFQRSVWPFASNNREMCHNVSEATRLDQATGRHVDTRNKWLAIYILGQIHHSLDQPKKAIKQYRQVEDRFDDARASSRSFSASESNSGN